MEKQIPKKTTTDTRRALKDSHGVPEEITRCVWMDAGVLTWWICDRDLQCTECPLDAALRRTSPTACTSPAGPTSIAPSRASSPWTNIVDRGLEKLDIRSAYSRSHVWVREEAYGLVRVGVDSFAAWVVGHVRSVILVSVGTSVERGDPCTWLDQDGGTLTVRSPLSGEVVESNCTLSRQGELQLDDPFGSDWLLLLRPFRLRTERKLLVQAADFEPVVTDHAHVWRRLLRKAIRSGATAAGRTLPDGGRVVTDLDELLGACRHTRIAAGFLRG